jgi:phosphate transport system permease protein
LFLSAVFHDMSEPIKVESPASPRPSRFKVPAAVARRVKIADRAASVIIRLGGAFVILVVAAIFVFVGREALPLFRAAQVELLTNAALPAAASPVLSRLVGIDEYETYAYRLSPTGSVQLTRLADWQPWTNLTARSLQKHPASVAYRSPSRDHLYIGTEDGHVLLAQIKFSPNYTAEGRTVEARFTEDKLIQISESGSRVTHIFGRHDTDGKAHFAALCADGRLAVGSYAEGDEPKIDPVPTSFAAPVKALAIDGEGRKLLVATDDGKLHHWFLEDTLEKPFATYDAGTPARKITAVEWIIGNNAALLGFADGTVEEWFGVREKEDDVLRPFKKIRSFETLPAAITALVPSGRDKGFLAASEDGTVRLFFTTSERTLVTVKAPERVEALCYAPKLTSFLAVSATQRASLWQLDNPHPEISWGSLFGKVWYEGYDKPEYNWQSTGGTDDFEAKLSLVPLTIGTLKAAFYGLLFAIPVAVLAAIYTSQFMSYRLRALVKPSVEIMAALPSVVIGFLAGLWLAPLMEQHVLSILCLFVIAPILILSAVTAWHHMPMRWRTRIPHGMELGVIVPLILIAFVVAIQLGPWIEILLFGGDLRQWVFNTTGQQFEQRNSIVIGFAMGFAVIPIIYTISEDALMNVPQHFVSGSLALGASRWQTATRIILPTASPGIFSAVMVGFGRAVGETMIVLMATGNTPILSFSPFNGMRTLSANIAVEIPEAPVAGTLYRVLFLAAILLFVLTFAVNTVAELIRQRLREKYKAV